MTVLDHSKMDGWFREDRPAASEASEDTDRSGAAKPRS